MSLQNIANTILVVEDNPDDFYAIQRVFERAALRNPLVHCETGEGALDYLLGRGAYADADVERPALILLDINLPGMKGMDVLQTIRSEATLKSIPVIMLTSSKDDRDVLASFQGRADAYLVKPAEFADFLMALQQLKHHAMHIVLAPIR
ncbi:MAG: response regulator [Nevskiales bacterium]